MEKQKLSLFSAHCR